VRRIPAVVAVFAAGAAAAWWRTRSASREHAELYFEDGSMVSLRADDDGAAELLARAREVLTAARS
jgi:hypothetical protein